MNRAAVVVAATLGAPAIVFAGPSVEVGGTIGLHVFSTESGLGVDENTIMTDQGEPNSQANSVLFAARLGVYFTSLLGVEVEGGVIPSEPREVAVIDIYNLTARGHLIAQFRASNPNALFVPFVLAGGGMMKVYQSDNPDVIAEEDPNFMFYGGVGVKYRAQNNWNVRLDVRGMFVPSSGDGQTQDFETLVSVGKEFGRPSKPKKIEEPPPPVDEDPDKDGIVGATDQCINEPEDKDAFQDEDGCPDLDNDGDGLADTGDKCPTEAEDKDNFQDDDGCPDPDNDGDGVPDAADKCSDQPETKNGFEDDDGCPDEIPEKLQQFTGVIQGINFKVSSADLAPGSTKRLDAAIAVLAEFKDTKLEIQGHTDDQAPRKGGKFADNQELSQARAEAVKQYMVSKGIEEDRLTAKGYGDTQPVVDPQGLKGGKLNAARAKNRRVEFKLIPAGGEEAATPPAEAPAEQPAPSE